MVTAVSRLNRAGRSMVAGLVVLILLSLVYNTGVLRQQEGERSLPVPAAGGSRAPVVEPDPRIDNVVPGVTDQVTIPAPAPVSHHGHHHH